MYGFLRRSARLPRWSAGVAALAVAAAAVLVGGAPTASADPIASCTSSVGARVAVDYGPFSGPLVVGCDARLTASTRGIDLLTAGGFSTSGDQHDGPQFLCRIATAAFPSPDATAAKPSGTGYPTPAQDPCVVTPPASAYWSYWLAKAGQNTWTYSPLGAYSDHPVAGEVEAWVYGGTDIGGTTGQPTFTPAQVRARTTATAARVALAAKVTPKADTADLQAAVHYLTTDTGANGITGTSLAADGYYDSATDWADWGLTIDGAFALAATKGDDATLGKVVALLDSAGADPSGNTVNSWTGAGTATPIGGAIGKEALLAEVTGYDPHDFSGQDLIAALDGSVCTAVAGQQCTAAGSYSYAGSVFSQALGIMAQLRAGDTANAAAPIQYLEGLQEPSGAWPSLIPSSGDADVDSTAMAVMALALVGDDTAKAAVSSGISWIAGQQEADGGFPGAAGDSTNSTALAIQGLTLDQADHQAQIDAATAFLAGQQNPDGGFNVAAGADPPQSDMRASTQVTGGLVGTSFGTLTDDVNPGGGTTTTTTTTAPPTTTTTAPPSTTTGTTTAPATTTDGGAPSIVDVGPGDGGSGAGGLAATGTGGGVKKLAWTGVDVLPLVGGGFLLIGAGVALVLWRRRRLGAAR
jgi:hypothetical protein